MLKNIVIAVLVAILLSYTMGYAASDWFDIRIQLDNRVLEPIAGILGFAVVAVLLVMIGFVVAVSVMGVVFFAVSAGFVGLFVMGIGAFWPMLLLAIVVILLVKDRSKMA
jgi:hypothetical protein